MNSCVWEFIHVSAHTSWLCMRNVTRRTVAVVAVALWEGGKNGWGYTWLKSLIQPPHTHTHTHTIQPALVSTDSTKCDEQSVDNGHISNRAHNELVSALHLLWEPEGCCRTRIPPVVIRKLVDSMCSVIPAFVRRWEIQTHLHETFSP
jgi:hypothetical protein